MKENKIHWIKKYALLLVCYYAIQMIGDQLYSVLVPTIETTMITQQVINLINFVGSFLLLNIILAIIISKDIRTLGINAKYSVLCTVFYAPMGVTLFLLYVILSEVKKSEEEFKTPPSFY